MIARIVSENFKSYAYVELTMTKHAAFLLC